MSQSPVTTTRQRLDNRHIGHDDLVIEIGNRLASLENNVSIARKLHVLSLQSHHYNKQNPLSIHPAPTPNQSQL